MYTLLINDDNTISTTISEDLIQRSTYVNKLGVVVKEEYEGVDYTGASVYMNYVLPVSKKVKSINLELSESNYSGTDYLLYTIPVTTELTAEAGDVEVSFTFVKTEYNNGTPISRVRKTESGTILIKPLAQFENLIVDDLLTGLDQRLVKAEALLNQLSEAANISYNHAADIKIVDGKIVLIDGDGNQYGDGIPLTDISNG